jgi:hypothetical protein
MKSYLAVQYVNLLSRTFTTAPTPTKALTTVAATKKASLLSCGSRNARISPAASIWKAVVRLGQFSRLNWHLQDAGVPFHPQDEVPKAPCPLCAVEKGDSNPKKLFRVVGQHLDEHDPQIPKEYFETPPAKLSGSSAGSSALRVSDP